MSEMYSIPQHIRPPPSKATTLIRPNFRCTEIVKYTSKLSISREATLHIMPLFHCRRCDLLEETTVQSNNKYCNLWWLVP